MEKENQCNWKKLDTAHKEDLVNDHFVPADVRMHYEHERAASRCSFSSSRSADQLEGFRAPSSASQYGDELVVENRPLHLSQPGDWQRSRSTKDLVYENEWSSNHVSKCRLVLSAFLVFNICVHSHIITLF